MYCHNAKERDKIYLLRRRRAVMKIKCEMREIVFLFLFVFSLEKIRFSTLDMAFASC